jgi:hypothetical protein
VATRPATQRPHPPVIFLPPPRQLAVPRQGGHIEEHVRTSHVGMAICNDAVDGLNHLWDEVGGTGLEGGGQAIQRAHVLCLS